MVPYFGLKGRPLLFWVTLGCSIAMMPFGFVAPFFLGTRTSYDQALSPNLPQFLSPSQHVTSSYNLASIFGALSVLYVGELLGRKRTILFSTAIMACGALLQVLAAEFVQMIAGRVVSGIGNGMATATAPVWLGEIAGPKERGRLVVVMMAASAGGFAVGNWVVFGLADIEGQVAFRVPIAVKLIFIILLLATVSWLPESPRWLISQGRVNQALTIIADLQAKDKNDESITSQAIQMINDVYDAKKNTPTWTATFRGRGGSTTRRALLGVGVQAMQQLSGVAVTAYCLPLVLTHVLDLSPALSRLLTACNATAFLLSSIGAVYIIPRYGRRRPMIYSSLGQGTALLAFTICARFVKDHTTNLAIIMIFVYHICFALGWQATPWLYPVELNNQAIRTRAVALSTATGWLLSFIIVQITPLSVDAIGWDFFVIWTVLNFAFAFLVFALYIETEGEVLEDIDWWEWEGCPVFGWGEKPDVRSRDRGDKQAGYAFNRCRLGSVAEEGGGQDLMEILRTEGTSVRDMAVGGLPETMKGYVMGEKNGNENGNGDGTEGGDGGGRSGRGGGSGHGQRQGRANSEVDPFDTSGGDGSVNETLHIS
ncbi:hypothetical protein B0T16DRAFT_363316 [Cercophora newfieldiana]|uniref:Major facilitator superfamily (MFS) profile domain-containing protein n=1 Tax=Cercophora newfieldiana TaxID=92897 RepID=A0AA39YUU0_9PEZI|nr:hypothetical protein B0T16DRAFT_363316 [Cercophora newfieldiana]